MTIFLFAGHNLKSDPGAVSGNRTEARETVSLRKETAFQLKQLQANFVTDNDMDDLRQTLAKTNTKSSSVVLDLHFNAGPASATGVEVLVGDDATAADMAFAKAVLNATTSTLGLRSRGIKKEGETPRKRLGVMREQGRVCLLEVCFISNPTDMASFDKNKVNLAIELARILKEQDALST